MFKKVPGNNSLLINLQKQIIDNFGNPVQLSIERNSVTLDFFGKNKKFDLTWLTLLAYYEVSSIVMLEDYIDKILFLPVDQKMLSVNTGVIMVFKEPIYFKSDFRYIPNFPRYAINLQSVVIDTLTNKVVDGIKNYEGYDTIYIYDPIKNKNRTVRIHRLLCYAWLPNNDFINRPFINHIDGIKNNNSLENLEWCSTKENSIHSFVIGLNKTNVKIKTRDIVTGEITIYMSIAEMVKKLGMRTIPPGIYNSRLPGFLYKKRYEIKKIDDESPWFYENNDSLPSKAIYTITVINKKTGSKEVFHNLNFFRKKYKLYLRYGNIDDTITIFKEKFKNYDISYKRNATTGPYSVYNIIDNTVTIFDSIWKAAEFINRSRTELQYDLCRDFKFIYSNTWIVVPGTTKFNIEDYKNKLPAFRKIVIENSNGRLIKIAKSIKDAARITGLQFRTIAIHLNKGTVTKGYIFRSLE